jgi:hypothetical protein
MERRKIQNIALLKIMEAFKSSPIKIMQRDVNILPLDVGMKEIRSGFAIQTIRDVSPRNPIRRQINSDHPQKLIFEQLFTKAKQMV